MAGARLLVNHEALWRVLGGSHCSGSSLFQARKELQRPLQGRVWGVLTYAAHGSLFSMGNTSALPMTSPSSLMAPGGGCWRDWQLGFLAGPAKVAHDERVLRVGWMVLPCGASATLRLPQVAFSILLQKHRDLLARRRLV